MKIQLHLCLLVAIALTNQSVKGGAANTSISAMAHWHCTACGMLQTRAADDLQAELGCHPTLGQPLNPHKWEQVSEGQFCRLLIKDCGLLPRPRQWANWTLRINQGAYGVVFYSHTTVMCFGSRFITLPSPAVLIGSVLGIGVLLLLWRGMHRKNRKERAVTHEASKSS